MGTFYGAMMAHFGGWVDDALMRIIEVIDSLPSLTFDDSNYDGAWKKFIFSASGPQYHSLV